MYFDAHRQAFQRCAGCMSQHGVGHTYASFALTYCMRLDLAHRRQGPSVRCEAPESPQHRNCREGAQPPLWANNLCGPAWLLVSDCMKCATSRTSRRCVNAAAAPYGVYTFSGSVCSETGRVKVCMRTIHAFRRTSSAWMILTCPNHSLKGRTCQDD